MSGRQADLGAHARSAKIGVILVNINPSYRLTEVQYALRHMRRTNRGDA